MCGEGPAQRGTKRAFKEDRLWCVLEEAFPHYSGGELERSGPDRKPVRFLVQGGETVGYGRARGVASAWVKPIDHFTASNHIFCTSSRFQLSKVWPKVE